MFSPSSLGFQVLFIFSATLTVSTSRPFFLTFTIFWCNISGPAFLTSSLCSYTLQISSGVPLHITSPHLCLYVLCSGE